MSNLVMTLLFACSSTQTPAPPEPAAPPEVEAPPPEPTGPPPVDLRVPPSVQGRAGRLMELERKIRDEAVPPEHLADMGHAEQRIVRALASDPVAAQAVLAELPEDLRAPVKTMIDATASIARTVPVPKSDLPDWRIVEPKPAAELLGYYRESEAAHGVPWQILASIHLNETRMGRLRGTSDAGAQGPMQFMPKTWEAFGEGDVNNDRDAIMAAGKYVAASGWDKDPDKAIWAYNHSKHYVKAIRDYAGLMEAEPRMFHALWGWQVYYRTVEGSIWLQTGYEQTERIPIATYCDEVGEPFCPVVHPR